MLLSIESSTPRDRRLVNRPEKRPAPLTIEPFGGAKPAFIAVGCFFNLLLNGAIANGGRFLPHWAVNLPISEGLIMKKVLSCIGATSVAAMFAFGSIVPATGAPIFVPSAQMAQPSDVIHIRDGMRWRGNNFRGGGWRHGGNWSGHNWRGNNFRRGGYHGWYNGYGGYDNDDLWYPGAALILGALIGSAIVNSSYYDDNYYGDTYYGGRYYGDRYYGGRHYGGRYTNEPYRDPVADPYLAWQRGDIDR
jgi:hypothetical protein